MIIQCAECDTRFVVPTAAIGPEGRMVKCSKCLHTWHQEAPKEDLEVVPEKVVEEEEKTATPSPQSSGTTKVEEDEVKLGDEPLRKNVPALIPEKKTGAIIGWVLLALFLIGGALSVIFLRDTLEDTLPFAATLYEKWDLIQNPPGPLEPEELPPNVVTVPHPAGVLTMRQSTELREGTGGPTLVIFLDIQNPGDQDVTLPDMQGVLRDGNGEDIFNWQQTLVPSVVPAGGFQQYEIFVETIQTRSRSAEVFFDWPEEE